MQGEIINILEITGFTVMLYTAFLPREPRDSCSCLEIANEVVDIASHDFSNNGGSYELYRYALDFYDYSAGISSSSIYNSN